MNKTKVNLGGRFDIKCFDAAGNLKWEDSNHNDITTLGMNHMLNTQFHAGTPVTTWYLILKDGGDAAVSDTMTSNAWAEFVNYSSGTRRAWPEGVASGGVMTNGTAVEFTVTGAGGVVGGAGLVSDSTKGGTGGTLFSIEEFSEGDKSTTATDTLSVTYTLTGADS